MKNLSAILIGAGDATGGAIDTDFISENFPERYALPDQDGIRDPDAIAEAYWPLHLQLRSAWTHKINLRPWMERS